MAESSTKPYLIRALHEWCTDHNYTPYISVSVDDRTIVPRAFVKAGEIVLNVSPLATHRLKITNEFVEFQARFGGVAYDLSIPIDNISAIYARETGHGMAFDVTKPEAYVESRVDGDDAPEQPTTPLLLSSATVTPLLRPISGARSDGEQRPSTDPQGPEEPDPPTPSPTPPPPAAPTPRLTRVK